MSFVLKRVDDRLIHGQVLVAWGSRLDPRRIWVADDAAADDPWERELFGAAAPGIDVRVVSLAEMARAYADEAGAPGGAFLLLRNLESARRLMASGAALSQLNIGGLHHAPGKAKVSEYVYLDEADRAAARALAASGVRLEVQDVPSAPPRELGELDPATRP